MHPIKSLHQNLNLIVCNNAGALVNTLLEFNVFHSVYHHCSCHFLQHWAGNFDLTNRIQLHYCISAQPGKWILVKYWWLEIPLKMMWVTLKYWCFCLYQSKLCYPLILHKSSHMYTLSLYKKYNIQIQQLSMLMLCMINACDAMSTTKPSLAIGRFLL